jgi:hypothetical protein
LRGRAAGYWPDQEGGNRQLESEDSMNAMMTAAGEIRHLGLVGWGGASLRRWMWWRERRQAARRAVATAVRWVTSEIRP